MDIKRVLKNKKAVVGTTITTFAVAVLLLAIIIFNKGSLTNESSLAKNNEDNLNSTNTSLTYSEISDLKDLGEIDIVPLITDSTGVDLNSAFKIVSQNKISPTLIQKAISISPQQEYRIEQVSDRELLINFSEPLKSDSIYRFTLGSRKSNYS